MLDASSLSLFITTSLMLAITPGPDIMFVFNQSLTYGVKAGVTITLGLCTGLIIHTSFVALGIALFIQQTPGLLPAMQSLGAIYLFYIAWRIYHSSSATLYFRGKSVPASYRKLYFRGFIMNVTNPKVMMFFLAFLPQFINQTEDVSTQIGLLGLIFMLVTLIIFGGLALVSDSLSSLFKQSTAWQKVLNKLSAIVIAAFSSYILLAALR